MCKDYVSSSGRMVTAAPFQGCVLRVIWSSSVVTCAHHGAAGKPQCGGYSAVCGVSKRLMPSWWVDAWHWNLLLPFAQQFAGCRAGGARPVSLYSVPLHRPSVSQSQDGSKKPLDLTCCLSLRPATVYYNSSHCIVDRSYY